MEDLDSRPEPGSLSTEGGVATRFASLWAAHVRKQVRAKSKVRTLGGFCESAASLASNAL